MPVGSLVLGIIGLVLSLVPFFGMYALPLTLLAVILGALGMKSLTGRGMAIGGLICGIIGTVLASWWMYATAAVSDGLVDLAKEIEAKQAADKATSKQ